MERTIFTKHNIGGSLKNLQGRVLALAYNVNGYSQLERVVYRLCTAVGALRSLEKGNEQVHLLLARSWLINGINTIKGYITLFEEDRREYDSLYGHKTVLEAVLEVKKMLEHMLRRLEK